MDTFSRLRPIPTEFSSFSIGDMNLEGLDYLIRFNGDNVLISMGKSLI